MEGRYEVRLYGRCEGGLPLQQKDDGGGCAAMNAKDRKD